MFDANACPHSVLLGRNDPPTAASVIKIDEDAEKQDVHAIFETPSSTESSPARIDSVHQRDGAANATIPGQAEASALSWATLYRNRSASECARSRLHLSRRDKSKVRFNVGDGDHHNHVEQGSGTAPERHDRCYVDRLDSLKLRDGVTEKEHSWRHDNDGSNLLKVTQLSMRNSLPFLTRISPKKQNLILFVEIFQNHHGRVSCRSPSRLRKLRIG